MTYGTQAAGLIGFLMFGAAAAASAQDAPVQDAPVPVPPAAAPAADTTAAPAAEAPAEAAPEATASDDPAAAQSGAGSIETGAGPAPASPEASPEAAPATGSDTPATAPKGPLVVVSWGGAYSLSQEEAVHRPFTRNTGIEISRKVYAGGLDLLRDQAASGAVGWDVMDVDPADATQGCAEGLFQKLSFVLPAAPDGTAATADFLPDTLQPCAVGSLAWSMVLAYNTGGYQTAAEGARADEVAPASLQDFFDLEHFPGRRGLRRSPMGNLEWALLADGAPAENVYGMLRTEEGVARAFAKLDSIRDSVVWWDDPREPGRLLADGEVLMTSTYNAPIFADIAVRQQPFAVIWDRQLWDIDLWAIPKGAPNREAAQEFIRFATGSGPLARQTRWIPYGPVRRSAAAGVGDYVYADVEMAPYLPTTEENLATALRNDAVFWRERGPALVERFNAWLAR